VIDCGFRNSGNRFAKTGWPICLAEELSRRQSPFSISPCDLRPVRWRRRFVAEAINNLEVSSVRLFPSGLSKRIAFQSKRGRDRLFTCGGRRRLGTRRRDESQPEVTEFQADDAVPKRVSAGARAAILFCLDMAKPIEESSTSNRGCSSRFSGRPIAKVARYGPNVIASSAA